MGKYLAAISLLVAVIFCIPSISVSGDYLGTLNANPYDPDSSSNPFGYGSPFSPDSINNPPLRGLGCRLEVSGLLPQASILEHLKNHGAGSPYRFDNPKNPFGEGLGIYGGD